MARYTHATFSAPCGVTFKLVLGNSTYSVAAFDRDGNRFAWSGRKWGRSLTDALVMAVYKGEPSEAESAIWFLFGRIDRYADRPGVLDLWLASKPQTAKAPARKVDPATGYDTRDASPEAASAYVAAATQALKGI